MRDSRTVVNNHPTDHRIALEGAKQFDLLGKSAVEMLNLLERMNGSGVVRRHQARNQNVPELRVVFALGDS